MSRLCPTDPPKAPERIHKHALPEAIATAGRALEERPDPYFWLKDAENPEVIAHLEAENRYCESYFQAGQDTRKELEAELRRRIVEDDTSVPVEDGPYHYFVRNRAGSQYVIFERYALNKTEGAAEVLLDVNALAEGHAFCDVAYCTPSPDHKMIAYAIDYEGDESYTIYIKDLASGTIREADSITADEGDREGAGSCLEWTEDSKAFYYTQLDAQHRPRWVRSHALGTPPEADATVYEEQDARFFVSLDRSESDRFVYIASEGNNMSEWYALEAAKLGAEPRLIEERASEHEYDVSDHGDEFIIRTNLNAEDFRLVRTPIATPGRAQWRDLISAQPGVLIEDFLVLEGYVALCERAAGRPRLRVYDFASDRTRNIALPGELYEVGLEDGCPFKSRRLRFSYQSLACTPEVYEFLLDHDTRRLLKKVRLPDPSFREARYRTRRIEIPATDGTLVPVSLLYETGTLLDGSAPLILAGYGAYGISYGVDFDTKYLPLVERGYVFAIAHVRGGMEMGYHWYRRGKLADKKNSFTDYIDVAKALVAANYTSAGRIVAVGGSAGGLLVGAAANMAAELFGAIVAHVPFVDVLTTMLDESLPLTTAEYNEWGDPREAEVYERLLAYSPYDNVSAQAYPPMLVVAGLSDMRVTFWEPTKWVQKLRQASTARNEILLTVEMDAGHSGASGRYDYLAEEARDLAFIQSCFEDHQEEERKGSLNVCKAD